MKKGVKHDKNKKIVLSPSHSKEECPISLQSLTISISFNLKEENIQYVIKVGFWLKSHEYELNEMPVPIIRTGGCGKACYVAMIYERKFKGLGH